MKLFTVPVDITIKAPDVETAKLHMEEFLTRAISEYRFEYGVGNYEVPFGYPIEEVSGS